jgi:hypothetical protein
MENNVRSCIRMSESVTPWQKFKHDVSKGQSPINRRDTNERYTREMITQKKHKLAIEKSMNLDPYTESLFREEKYDQLIWFESRRTNILLEQLITLNGGVPIVPTIEEIHVEIEQSPEERKVELCALEEAIEGDGIERPGEMEETDPVIEEGTPEEQSLSKQERESAKRTVKRRR